MSRVLILGAQGMLGSALVRAFADQEVLAWDRTECDVLDTAQLRSRILEAAPGVIVNAVAYTNVDRAEEEPELARQLNADVPEQLALLAKELAIPFVHVSTAYVFDGTSEAGYGESDTVNPQYVYQRTKYEGEQRAQAAYAKTYIVRTNWLFGAPGTGEGSKMSFVDKISGIAKERSAVQLVADEIGSPTYAEDLAHQIRTLLETQEPGLYHAVNAGSCSWMELAQEAFRLQGITVDVTPISGKLFQRASPPPMYSIVRCEKTGPMRPWQEALADYLAGNV